MSNDPLKQNRQLHQAHPCECGGACGCDPPAAKDDVMHHHASPVFNVDEAQVRTETVGGREYRVAPVVAAIGGDVMNNALVPLEELQRSLPSWNGRPLPVNHPEMHGQPISANTPHVLEQTSVGQFFNAQIDAEGRFKGELWIDTERANAISPTVMERLEEGQLEVSTAYFAMDEAAQGSVNGEPYGVIHRQLLPDHVALLPNERGACSWEDGCGAPRVNEEESMQTNVRSTARTPSYSGTTSGEWSKPGFAACASAVGSGADSVADLTSDERSRIAAMSLLGDADADTFDGLLFFPVVEPSSGNLSENALDAVLSGRGSQADIPAEALESARSKARSLLESEFDRDLEENQGMAAQAKRWLSRIFGHAHHGDKQNQQDTDSLERELMETLESQLNAPVFVETVFFEENQVMYELISDDQFTLQMRSYSRDGDGNIVLGEDVQDMERVVSFQPVSNESGAKPPEAEPPEVQSMTDKETRIGELIENKATPFTEDDRETLRAFSEDKIQALAAQDDGDGDAPATNADQTVETFIEQAPEGIRDSLQTMHEEHQAKRKELVGAIQANEANAFTEQELYEMDTNRLKKLSAFARQPSYEGRGAPDREAALESNSDSSEYTAPSLTQRMRDRKAG